MNGRPSERSLGTTSPRRLRLSETSTLVVAVVAVAAALPFESVAASALAGLTVLLMGWPVGLLAVLMVRWSRQRDFRFVGLALALGMVAAVSATVSVLLSRGT